jgi:hypothetical protein
VIRIATTLLIALTLASTGACGSGDEGARHCAIVADATSFYENTDVAKKIDENAPIFLKKCASVAFTVISGSVITSDCRERPLQLTGDAQANPNNNPVRAEQISRQRRTAALQTLKDLLACARAETATLTGSDVIGALLESARQTSALGPADLLIISDMAQHTKELDLYQAAIATPGERTQIIQTIKAHRRLPDLKDCAVQFIGFGVKVTPDPIRQQALRDFWDEFFAAAGAPPATYL